MLYKIYEIVLTPICATTINVIIVYHPDTRVIHSTRNESHL